MFRLLLELPKGLLGIEATRCATAASSCAIQLSTACVISQRHCKAAMVHIEPGYYITKMLGTAHYHVHCCPVYSIAATGKVLFWRRCCSCWDASACPATVSSLCLGPSGLLTMPATLLLRHFLLPPLCPASAGLQVTRGMQSKQRYPHTRIYQLNISINNEKRQIAPI
jgi:hypothetical protein